MPRGRVIEIFGPESSGKTTLALQVIAEAQKKGGMAAFVDAEHALDAAYAKKLGVDLDNLLVSQPDNGEQALEIVEVLIRSNSVDVVVVDSVAALVPRAEIEGEMGEAQMGLQARLMSQALRKLTGAVSKSKTSLIFINQLREKIGVMFGNPETTTGGRALKFYSSVRIDIRRIGAIKDGENVVGGRTRVKIVKNKMAPPFREAEFDIMYGEGVSREGDLIDIAVEHKIIEKSGAWFAYGGERLGQGRENVKSFLKENIDLRTAIEEKVRKALGMVKETPEPVGSKSVGLRHRPRNDVKYRVCPCGSSIAEDDATSRTILQAVLTEGRLRSRDSSGRFGGRRGLQTIRRAATSPSSISSCRSIDGLELVREVRAIPASRPPYIIIVSTKGETADVVAGLDAGADDYLVKPFDAAELRARIEVGRRMLEMRAELADKVQELAGAPDRSRPCGDRADLRQLQERA